MNNDQAQVIKTQLPDPPPSPEALLKAVEEAVDNLKAKDTVVIDVRGKSSVTDHMVITSGTSTRHVKSIADEVVKMVKRLQVMPLGVEGEREADGASAGKRYGLVQEGHDGLLWVCGP